MRKANKEITDRPVIERLLGTCAVGRLGTNGRDGYPVVKPLNFAYHGGRIYFHTAKEGEKIEDIGRDDRVCFEVDLPIAFVKGMPDNPCKAEYLYRSVIAFGRATIVADEAERGRAFKALMDKYQPGGEYGPYLPEKLGLTGIVRIEIERMTGKEDLGTGALREKVLAALKAGAQLPLELERE